MGIHITFDERLRSRRRNEHGGLSAELVVASDGTVLVHVDILAMLLIVKVNLVRPILIDDEVFMRTRHALIVGHETVVRLAAEPSVVESLEAELVTMHFCQLEFLPGAWLVILKRDRLSTGLVSFEPFL